MLRFEPGALMAAAVRQAKLNDFADAPRLSPCSRSDAQGSQHARPRARRGCEPRWSTQGLAQAGAAASWEPPGPAPDFLDLGFMRTFLEGLTEMSSLLS
jgi:hypothetical protein